MLTRLFGEPLIQGDSITFNRVSLGWHIFCTIFLPFYFIFMIYMGSKYVHSCPIDNLIPISLIIMGIYCLIEEVFRRVIAHINCFYYIVCCGIGIALLTWASTLDGIHRFDADFIHGCHIVVLEVYYISCAILSFCVAFTIVLFVCESRSCCQRSDYTSIN